MGGPRDQESGLGQVGYMLYVKLLTDVSFSHWGVSLAFRRDVEPW